MPPHPQSITPIDPKGLARTVLALQRCNRWKGCRLISRIRCEKQFYRVQSIWIFGRHFTSDCLSCNVLMRSAVPSRCLPFQTELCGRNAAEISARIAC